jgi:[NiFe] hydrogenase diaphorase moiety large subunit
MTNSNNLVIFSEIDVEKALKNALEKSRPDIISEVRDSGLKGRGGAGFPTGIKWNLAASAQGDCKFVICNADEGEPGTFKDRVLLTDYPRQLFAGMVLAGYAIGAKEGIVYLRAEYTYLRKDLEAVLEQMRKENILGNDICGKKGFNYDIHIHMGSGAYICGEETALIESLEGQRGEPRNRPPFPVTVGYLNCPTAVNNVETFITALHIVEKSSKWFKGYGTEKSTGTKLFSVSGDCDKSGVYEFPMGITIEKLLQEVGGEDAKAVQVGGASGTCVPRSEFSKTIAYEDVSTGGSIIVFGPHRNMLDVAINFMEFFCEESCGQCTPCRVGTETLLEGLDMLEAGTCSMKYLRELISLGETMQVASKCGLGQSAPNAFLSIVKNFKSEIFQDRY